MSHPLGTSASSSSTATNSTTATAYPQSEQVDDDMFAEIDEPRPRGTVLTAPPKLHNSDHSAASSTPATSRSNSAAAAPGTGRKTTLRVDKPPSARVSRAATTSISSSEFESGGVSSRTPLCIVGIGCRLPGGVSNTEQLWSNLTNGVNSVISVPGDRWNCEQYASPLMHRKGHIRSTQGGFLLSDHWRPDTFDADFFRLSPVQASGLDPQQRLLLELAYETFEDAGVGLDELNASKTGVFVGGFQYDWMCLQSTPQSGMYSAGSAEAMGVAVCSLSNRISYAFNLKGPSFTVDTACSGSLVAIHLACQAIWNGECTQAITGGVNLMLKPESSILLSRGGFLSDQGKCASFDASGSGYVRGEGAGLLMIKPLCDALRDGNEIYSLIRGSATNSDGFTSAGLTVPNSFAHSNLMKELYAKAGVDPKQVSYMECHGTGTAVGDPIELAGLSRVFTPQARQNHPLYIGSIKSNIGHLEGGAGVAGVIKASLVLRNDLIPPNLHFHTPNPVIPFEKYGFVVPTKSVSLPRMEVATVGQPACAGINSFGAGGSNAHVILQQYFRQSHTSSSSLTTPPSSSSSDGLQQHWPRLFFFLSARSAPALLNLAVKYLNFLKEHPSDAEIRRISLSLFLYRSHLTHRVSIVAKDGKSLMALLEQYVQGKQHHAIVTSVATPMTTNLPPDFPSSDSASHQETAACKEEERTERASVMPTLSEEEVTSETIFEDGPPSLSIPPSNKLAPEGVVFVFSGQGGQWSGMGRSLLQSAGGKGSHRVFTDTLTEFDKHFHPMAGWSIRDTLLDLSLSDEVLNSTDYVQPLIAAVQIGLYHVWLAAGIQPAGIIGHSIGEVAAAYAAGCISLADAAYVIWKRSHAQQKMEGTGKMLAVGIDHASAALIVQQQQARLKRAPVEVATINSSNLLTFSGDSKLLDELIQHLPPGTFHKMVAVEVPYHSRHMEHVKQEILRELYCITGKPVKEGCTLYSTVTGEQSSGTNIDAAYWYDNIRQPVLFTQAMENALNDGFRIFIEIGPHPVLQAGMQDRCDRFNKQQFEKMDMKDEVGEVHPPAFALHSTLRNRDELSQITLNIGWTLLAIRRQLAQDGPLRFQSFLDASANILHNFFSAPKKEVQREGDRRIVIDLTGFHPQRVKLPGYGWARQSFWRELQEDRTERLGGSFTHLHPFFHRVHCSASTPSSVTGAKRTVHQQQRALSQQEQGSVVTFHSRVHTSIFPYLAEHVVDQAIVFPATAHLEFVFGAAREIYNALLESGECQVEVTNVMFAQACIIPSDDQSPLMLRLECHIDSPFASVSTEDDDHDGGMKAKVISGTASTFTLFSAAQHDNNEFVVGKDDHARTLDRTWGKHSTGQFRIIHLESIGDDHAREIREKPPRLTHFQTLESIRAHFKHAVNQDLVSFYESLSSISAIQYGPQFQCIQRLCHDGNYIFAELQLSEETLHAEPELSGHGRQYNIHPAIFDAALHASFIHCINNGDSHKLYLPHGVGSLRLLRPLSNGLRTKLSCLIHVHSYELEEIKADFTIFDAEVGVEVLKVKNLISRYFLRGESTRASDDLPKHAARIHWLPVDLIEGTTQFVDLQRSNLTRFYHYQCRQVILFADRSRTDYALALKEEIRTRGASIEIRVVWIQDLLLALSSIPDSKQSIRELIRLELKSLPLVLDKRTHVIVLPAAQGSNPVLKIDADDKVKKLEEQLDELDQSTLFVFDLLNVLVTNFVAPFARLYLLLTADLPLELPSSVAQLQCDLDLFHGGFFGLLRVFLAEHPSYLNKTIISSLSSNPLKEEISYQVSQVANELYHWKPEIRELEIWYAGSGRRYVRTIRKLNVDEEVSTLAWSIAQRKHYALCFDEDSRKLKFVTLPKALLEVNSNPARNRPIVVVRISSAIQVSGLSMPSSSLVVVPYRLNLSYGTGLPKQSWMIAGEITASEDSKFPIGSQVIARARYGLVTSMKLLSTNVVCIQPSPSRSLQEVLAVFYDQLLIAHIFGKLIPTIEPKSKVVILLPPTGHIGTSCAAFARFLRQDHLDLDVHLISDAATKTNLSTGSVQVMINTCSDQALSVNMANLLAPYGSSFVQIIGASSVASPLPPLLTQRLPTGCVQHIVDLNQLAHFNGKAHAELLRKVATHLGVAAHPSSSKVNDSLLLAPFHPPVIEERSFHDMVDNHGVSLNLPVNDVHVVIQHTIPPSASSVEQKLESTAKSEVEAVWREKTGVESWLQVEAKSAELPHSVESVSFPSSSTLVTPSSSVVELGPPAWHLFSSTQCYVITGGCSGLGFELMEHMRKQGARSFVLVSRSGIKPDDHTRQVRVATARANGIKIRVYQCDISRANETVALFELLHSRTFQEEYGSLGGIIHCAGLLDDQLITKLSRATFQKVFLPKAGGGVLLHLLAEMFSPELPIFVCISSIGAICGFLGQASYAAANALLDGLATKRNVKALFRLLAPTPPSSLPTIVNCSINYGLLSDYAGMSNSNAISTSQAASGATPASAPTVSVFDILESQGLTKMPLYDCLAKFDLALCHADLSSQMLASRIDWKVFANPSTVWTVDTTYQHLLLEAKRSSTTKTAAGGSVTGKGSSQKLSARLANPSLDSSQRLAIVLDGIHGLLHRLLGVTVRPDGSGALDVNTSIDLFGVDSLILSQMRAWITKEIGVPFPMMALLKGPTPKQLSQQIVEMLREANQTTSDPTSKIQLPSEDGGEGWMSDYKNFTLLSPWLVRGHKSPGDSAKVRLICFHSMGASALLFQKTLYMPPTDDVDVLAVQSPGRGHHIGPNVRMPLDLNVFLDQLMKDLLPLLDRPCIFWGHSFGGIIAYELIRYIQLNHPSRVPHVCHLQISGTCPPHLMRMLQTRDTLLMGFMRNNSQELVDVIQQYADSTKFLTGLLPTMQLDLPLLMNYPPQMHPSTWSTNTRKLEGVASATSSSSADALPSSPTSTSTLLPCSMTSWAGLRDDIAHPEEIAEWSAYVTPDHTWELKQVDGDHWFINVHNTAIHEHLQGIIRKHTPI